MTRSMMVSFLFPVTPHQSNKCELNKPPITTPQVEIVLRTEADWLRESYDTLTLVFQKNAQSDALLEMGPRHRRGALSAEIGTYFEERMNNRLGLLDHLRTRIGETRVPEATIPRSASL